jgi:hypothetical protein
VPGSLPVNPQKPRLNGPDDDHVDSDDDDVDIDDDKLTGLASLSTLHPLLFVQSKVKELPSRQGVRRIGRQEHKRRDNLVVSCKLELAIRLLYLLS